MHILKYKGESIIEKYYLWLSMFCNVNYETLVKLIKVFGSIENIYKISKVKFLFKEYLVEGKVFISNDIYSNLTNLVLKQKSDELYQKFRHYNINILTLKEKIYYDIFYFLRSYQLCLFSIGNLELLKSNNKINIYKNDSINSSNYIKNLYNEFSIEVINNGAVQVELLNNLDIIDDSKIYIINFVVNENMLNLITKKNLSNSLILFTSYNFSKNYNEFNMFLLSTILDKVIVLESEYSYKNITFIDNVLNHSKDVFVVPGNIYNRSNYFSNYLIKLGANVILSKNDIKNIIIIN